MRSVDRNGPVTAIPSGATVLCTAVVPKGIHVGVYVVDKFGWAIRGARYYDNDPCKGRERRGCPVAMQLRLLSLALQRAVDPSTLTLQVTDREALELLQLWQSGTLTLPTWYSGGKRGTLGELAVAMSTTAQTTKVKIVERAAGLGLTAKQLAEAARVAMYSSSDAAVPVYEATVARLVVQLSG